MYVESAKAERKKKTELKHRRKGREGRVRRAEGLPRSTTHCAHAYVPVLSESLPAASGGSGRPAVERTEAAVA